MPEMIHKILIVDDHQPFLNGMEKALKRYCGYAGEIKTVENGKKAIEEVSACFYEICFLDLNLPDVNGLDVMDKIHYISPGTKVVIMTAELLNGEVKMKVEKGASLFIPKPVELNDIRNFILNEAGVRDESMEKENSGKETQEKEKGDQNASPL
jgi:DNA-binding NtrC family response regulator